MLQTKNPFSKLDDHVLQLFSFKFRNADPCLDCSSREEHCGWGGFEQSIDETRKIPSDRDFFSSVVVCQFLKSCPHYHQCVSVGKSARTRQSNCSIAYIGESHRRLLRFTGCSAGVASPSFCSWAKISR